MAKKERPRGRDAIAAVEYARAQLASYAGMAARAWHGDTEQARALIEWVAQALPNRPETIPEPIREYMSACLYDVLAGADPATAFNLKTTKHRPKAPDWRKLERDKWVADAVSARVDAGSSIEAAVAHVADNPQKFEKKVGRLGAGAVKKVYLRFKQKTLDIR